MQIPPAFSGV